MVVYVCVCVCVCVCVVLSRWSGFYTSRAALKSSIRKLYSLIHAADIFFSWANLEHLTLASDSFEALEQAHHLSGILQHHDAVTGTAADKGS